MKGNKVVESKKEICDLILFHYCRQLYFHISYHFITNRIYGRFCSHRHHAIIELFRKPLIKIFYTDIF